MLPWSLPSIVDSRAHRIAALAVAALPMLAAAFWRSRGGRRTEAGVRRGARVLRYRHRPRGRRGGDCGRITIAGFPVSALDETKHFKILGTTGTGKSTAIREILAGALARGDRVVVADPDGGYLGRFFRRRRGDAILNPFDTASLRWDWREEMCNPYDAELLAHALVPASPDAAGEEWRGYARTFLAAVIRRSWEIGARPEFDLWRLLAVAPAAQLRPLVAGSAAQPFLDPDNARMFGSIRSVAASAVAALEHVNAQRARRFSVRRWIVAAESSSALFIPYKATQIAALRNLISAWMRLAVFEAMNAGEGRDLRLWFVVDELDALGAIDGLKDALARLRKFGGRCVLGFQSIAQVSSTYGHGSAQTIVENCSNTLILRCAGSENGGTSQFASRLIGDREVRRRQTARSRDHSGGLGSSGSRRSTNISDQTVVEAAVLASEIERLPDGHGYLKLASSPVWREARLRAGAC
ncbi:MAG: type IV secretion system DNA-binding domain-containing protein [Gammaproteobacteria bacterium]|nr:type IV secretion system DNA-binding domain-containing protein [Gammaproteobacteria bacterium]